MKHILVIDPGVSGGFVLRRLAPGSPIIKILKYTDELSAALGIDTINVQIGLTNVVVVMEQVHASPVMSPSSAFAFGTNYGVWKGLLAAHHKQIFGITPHQWQQPWARELEGLQGTKRKSALNRIAKLRAAAHVTLETCDAFLISEFCIDQYASRGSIPGKIL